MTLSHSPPGGAASRSRRDLPARRSDRLGDPRRAADAGLTRPVAGPPRCRSVWSRSEPIAASTGATPASARPARSPSWQSAPALPLPRAVALAPATTRNRSPERRAMMTSVLRVLAALALLAVFAPAAQAMEFSPWATAVNAEDLPGTSNELNTSFQDSCPIQAPDGLSLFIASTRPSFTALRGPHRHPGPRAGVVERPLGRAAEPGGHRSTPPPTTSVPRLSAARGCLRQPARAARRDLRNGLPPDAPQSRSRLGAAEHLCCQSTRPNTPLDEQDPRTSNGRPTALLLERSRHLTDAHHGVGSFSPAQPVAELNSSGMDIQPNVRRDAERSCSPRTARHQRVRGQTSGRHAQDVNGPGQRP